MPNWYFSKEGLVRTPSRLDGIDYMTETRYRREGTRFIMNCGNKMRLYPFIWMFVVSLFVKLITSQVVITYSCWYRTMNYTVICDSFENEALENEEQSTKRPKLENEAPKSRKRSTQNSKTKHPRSKTKHPISKTKTPKSRKRSTLNSETKHSKLENEDP